MFTLNYANLDIFNSRFMNNYAYGSSNLVSSIFSSINVKDSYISNDEEEKIIKNPSAMINVEVGAFNMGQKSILNLTNTHISHLYAKTASLLNSVGVNQIDIRNCSIKNMQSSQLFGAYYFEKLVISNTTIYNTSDILVTSGQPSSVFEIQGLDFKSSNIKHAALRILNSNGIISNSNFTNIWNQSYNDVVALHLSNPSNTLTVTNTLIENYR